MGKAPLKARRTAPPGPGGGLSPVPGGGGGAEAPPTGDRAAPAGRVAPLRSRRHRIPAGYLLIWRAVWSEGLTAGSPGQNASRGTPDAVHSARPPFPAAGRTRSLVPLFNRRNT